MGLVLDTSVVIDFLRGHLPEDLVLAGGRQPMIVSTVTIHEVSVGLRGGEEAVTSQLLESFAIAGFGIAEAELSARWRREYGSRGVTLDLADTAIAATAAIRNLPLATGNVKHFPMPELRVEQWPPPAPA
jgi:predicted nucleic acid-binding protein